MSSLFGDTPTPPNPIQTAAASTSTNVATGVANAMLNNVNQNTPEGALRYDVTSNYGWNDPVTGVNYSIPQFTATQSLSPFGQELQGYQQSAQRQLGQAAGAGATDINALLQGSSNPLDTAPIGIAPGFGYLSDNSWAQQGFGDVGQQQRGLGNYGQQQSGFADAGQQQGQFGDAGALTRDYGPADNFSADRSRVEESLYGRLNPQLERERAGIEQRLADQGIRYGSEAYTRAMDDYSRQANDARLAVTQTAGQEQQRMNDMAAQRAGFQNAAQMQAYEQARGRGTFANAAQEAAYKQAQGRGQFANEAQMNAFQQMLQSGTFANQAQKDAFQQEATRAEFFNAGAAQNDQRDLMLANAQNQQRNQYLQEQYAQRNQQFNEITALMSGSQVSAPNFVSTNQNQIAGTDVAGLINNRFSQDMDTYKQQSANFNSLMGGIFGAMGGMVKSDRREKENIEKVGTIFAAGPDSERELPIYAYDYKKDDPDGERHVGPMAQDIEKLDKRAVQTRKGVKYINTTRMGSIMKVA